MVWRRGKEMNTLEKTVLDKFKSSLLKQVSLYKMILFGSRARGDAGIYSDMDVVVIVLDSTENPYNQVNITIIGNLQARDIPVLIVANKTDLKKSDIKKIEAAFPEYDVVGISAKFGKNMEEFYESLFKLVKKRR